VRGDGILIIISINVSSITTALNSNEKKKKNNNPSDYKVVTGRIHKNIAHRHSYYETLIILQKNVYPHHPENCFLSSILTSRILRE